MNPRNEYFDRVCSVIEAERSNGGFKELRPLVVTASAVMPAPHVRRLLKTLSSNAPLIAYWGWDSFVREILEASGDIASGCVPEVKAIHEIAESKPGSSLPSYLQKRYPGFVWGSSEPSGAPPRDV